MSMYKSNSFQQGEINMGKGPLRMISDPSKQSQLIKHMFRKKNRCNIFNTERQTVTYSIQNKTSTHNESIREYETPMLRSY